MNNAVKWFGIIAMLAITVIAVANTALAVPIYFYPTEVDGTEIYADDTNSLSLERDNTLNVKLDFVAYEDDTNLEIEAFISGYEYGDSTHLSATTGVFDVTANTEYVKKLTFKLPDDVQTDSYKLRVIATDRNGWEYIENYNLKIDSMRHVIKIMNVGLSESRIKSGAALLSTVRVENQGQYSESDVKVTVSVPELGLSATDYLDTIKQDKQKDTEEMYIRVPKCAKPGVYNLNAEVSYSRGHETVKSSVPFEIVEDDSCKPAPAQPTQAVVVVQQPVQPVTSEPVADTASDNSGVKTALEVILLVLIGLLVVIGIVLGLSRMGRDDETEAV
jgi:methionine-rich copper-binding protein CopC